MSFDSQDAFDNIVERLIASVLDNERGRARVASANAEVAQFKADVANATRAVGSNLQQAQKAQDDIRGLLKEIRSIFPGGSREHQLVPTDLIVRLEKAISGDTDDIPF